MSGILQSLGIERGFLALVAAFLIWLVVIGCAVTSIVTQNFSRKEKMVWLAVIIGVPLLGLMAYLPFSIRKDNHPVLFQAKK